jgi:MoaA/NifB/PqqE/SkfB family radical SAM enzyme
MHHLTHLQKLVNKEHIAPIHVSVWPNSSCNFHCKWCCGQNIEDRSKELTLNQYIDAIDILSKYGTKAIEFSGVIGEPLLWKPILKAIDYNYQKNIKTSLITNGTYLKNVPVETLKKLSWIRVSLQSAAHMNSIDFETVSKYTSINGSYLLPKEKVEFDLVDLYNSAKKRNIIIRVGVAKPCKSEWEEEAEEKVLQYGEPIFFSKKQRGIVKGCYMPWVRAAIDWNGNFLPCVSIQLNPENEGYIPDEYILCKIEKLEEWILNNPIRDLGYRCSLCNCGVEMNNFVYDLLQEMEDVDFV